MASCLGSTIFSSRISLYTSNLSPYSHTKFPYCCQHHIPEAGIWLGHSPDQEALGLPHWLQDKTIAFTGHYSLYHVIQSTLQGWLHITTTHTFYIPISQAYLFTSHMWSFNIPRSPSKYGAVTVSHSYVKPEDLAWHLVNTCWLIIN